MVPFQKYVVYEVITTPSLEDEKIEFFYKKISNEKKFCHLVQDGEDVKYHIVAPRQSVIAKPIANGRGRDKESGALVIMYPFFSSHVSLPIKPGEHIWGFEGGPDEMYWLSRIHGSEYIEDTNFTHVNRSAFPTAKGTEELDDDDDIDTTPGFPNGDSPSNRMTDRSSPGTLKDLREEGISPEAFTLPNIDTYEKITTGSYNASSIVAEPVPRITKRPGDMVIQGSNNSCIILGTERGYAKKEDRTINQDKSSSIPENDDASKSGLSEGMGAIDIVVGRGRLLGGLEANANKNPVDTRPRLIKNTRDNFETDKNTGLDDTKAPDGSGRSDVAEGDPDFFHDASRVYMSMKTDPDTLFGLEYPNQPTSGNAVAPTPDNSSIVFKSDQIRIVARKDAANTINGSIRIIKEGTAEADRATIVMQPDGSIMIDGPKIIIGDGREDPAGANGQGTQVVLGRDATESIVLGNILLDKLIALESAFNDHIHNSMAGSTTKHHANGAGPGVQSAEFASGPGAAEDADTPGSQILSKVGKTK